LKRADYRHGRLAKPADYRRSILSSVLDELALITRDDPDF
jgi:hypothetical protein